MKTFNQRGFSPVLIISVFVVLVASIPLGAFYIKGQIKEKTKTPTHTSKPSEIPQPSPSVTEEKKPESTITAFFLAVQSKDKVRARGYLSENVNKAAFNSTFEDTNLPSLYNQEFSFKIVENKLDLSGVKAFVTMEIIVSGHTLPTLVTLEKNSSGVWLISNSETTTTGATNLPFQTIQQELPKRVLLLLTGPADVYLTSPEGTSAGYDPKTGERLNGINGVYYDGRLPDELESFAVTHMIGSWQLKVIGNGDGEYALTTRLVDTFKEDQVKKIISKGKVDTYILRYPDKAEKLEVILIQ